MWSVHSASEKECFSIALPRLLSAFIRENNQPSSYATTILAMSQLGLASSMTSFGYTSIRRMKLLPGSRRATHPVHAPIQPELLEFSREFDALHICCRKAQRWRTNAVLKTSMQNKQVDLFHAVTTGYLQQYFPCTHLTIVQNTLSLVQLGTNTSRRNAARYADMMVV
jgi:hypothetical protein